MATFPARERQRTNQFFAALARLTGQCAPRYANIEGLSPWTKEKLSPEEYLRKEVVELNNGRLAMIAIAGFVAAELKSPGTEVFQHLFEILDYDLIKEVDLVEDIVGAPETPLPELDADTLSNLGFK